MQSLQKNQQITPDLREMFQKASLVLNAIQPGTSDLIIAVMDAGTTLVIENEQGPEVGLPLLWEGARRSPTGQAALLARDGEGFLLIIARRDADEPEFYIGYPTDDGFIWTDQLSRAQALELAYA